MARITFEALFRLINLVLMAACAMVLIGLVSIIAAEITLRAFFATSLSWIHETSILLAAWLYFLGVVIVYHNSRDITVTLVGGLLYGRRRTMLARFYQLITGLVFLTLAYQSWRLMMLQWPFSTPGVGFPRVLFTLPLFIGAGLIGLECLSRTLFPPAEVETRSEAVRP